METLRIHPIETPFPSTTCTCTCVRCKSKAYAYSDVSPKLPTRKTVQLFSLPCPRPISVSCVSPVLAINSYVCSVFLGRGTANMRRVCGMRHLLVSRLRDCRVSHGRRTWLEWHRRNVRAAFKQEKIIEANIQTRVVQITHTHTHMFTRNVLRIRIKWLFNNVHVPVLSLSIDNTETQFSKQNK